MTDFFSSLQFIRTILSKRYCLCSYGLSWGQTWITATSNHTPKTEISFFPNEQQRNTCWIGAFGHSLNFLYCIKILHLYIPVTVFPKCFDMHQPFRLLLSDWQCTLLSVHSYHTVELMRTYFRTTVLRGLFCGESNLYRYFVDLSFGVGVLEQHGTPPPSQCWHVGVNEGGVDCYWQAQQKVHFTVLLRSVHM